MPLYLRKIIVEDDGTGLWEADELSSNAQPLAVRSDLLILQPCLDHIERENAGRTNHTGTPRTGELQSELLHVGGFQRIVGRKRILAGGACELTAGDADDGAIARFRLAFAPPLFSTLKQPPPPTV